MGFAKITSRDGGGGSMSLITPGFIKMMNEFDRNNLQVSTMQVNVQFLHSLQLQPECDPEQARRDKDMKKNLALLAKYFSRSCATYQQTTLSRTSSNRKRLNIPHHGINNDNQSGQFGNQRTMTVAGARETDCRKAKAGLKDFAYHKEKDDV
ncbi:hypothetical protein Tco_1204303 [Tanacetum coccineum]